MQSETLGKIEVIKTAIALLRKHVGDNDAKSKLISLNNLILDGDFWNDQARAQETMREKNRLERKLLSIDNHY